MTSRPGFRAALIVAVLVVGACGSTPGAAAPSAPPAATAAAAPSAAAATQATAVAVEASVGQPTSGAATDSTTGQGGIDRNWTKAVAHVEITGGRTLTIDGLGAAFAMGGITSVNFTDEAHTYAIGMTIGNGEESGVAIVAANLITGGTFGKECQINVTRNEPAELAGTFSCTNAEGADPTTVQNFRVDIQGSFSAKP